jgi:hypothetical protein
MMSIWKLRFRKRAVGAVCFLYLSCLGSQNRASAQNYEVTPLFGARFGGTIKTEQAFGPNFDAHISDSFAFGIAAGYRFEDSWDSSSEEHNLIEFRWMRQDSHLYVKQDPLHVNPLTASFRPGVTLDHFLVDLTHEYTVRDYRVIQPFITVSLGATLLSAPASNTGRVAFGIGGGMKVFPTTHYGLRLQVEYLPTVMSGQLQNLVCAGGSCVIGLYGGIMNQFQVSLGPAFRF